MYRSRIIYLVASAVVFAGMTLPAGAADRFALSRAVPEDVFIYIHGAHNPERDAINARWGEIWQALVDARLQDDVRNMIRGLAPGEEERAEVDAFWSKVSGLIDGVEWRKLASSEFVYCSRMKLPMPEYLILLRGDPDATEKNVAGFRAMLEEVVKVSEGKLTLEVAEDNGNALWTLKSNEFPFKVQVARRGDVIALGASQTLLSDALGLLAGGAGPARLTESPRFRSALKSLPEAEDAIVYVDVARLLDDFRAMLKEGEAKVGDNEDGKVVFRVVGKLLDRLDILDLVVTAEQTDGSRALTHTVARLKPGAAEKPFGKVFCNQKPIAKFDRYIPKEATNFAVGTGFDLRALYALALDFVRTDVPDGEKGLQEWEQAQQEIGFHVERDLLSWLTLEYTVITLPPAVPSMFAQQDTVLMLRVRDGAKARAQIDGWLQQLQTLLGEHGQTLMIADAQVEGADGFKSVTHPIFAAFARPVYGVYEDRLILSNSAQAVATCLATARGEHPTIAEADRVRQEGIVPAGPADSVSFTDQRQLGAELAGTLGIMSFAINLGAAGAGAEDPKVGQLLTGVGGILGKLSPIVAKIDFLSSNASATTFDGQAWHTTGVTTYQLEPRE